MLATAPDMPDRDRRDPAAREARIDLRCHSRYSTSANMWLATELGFKESHTKPAAVYSLAKMRGMTHVTLTDHDSIEGTLRLALHEDFIIGEEVTAFFPSEALHVHVLVWGAGEHKHTEIDSTPDDRYLSSTPNSGGWKLPWRSCLTQHPWTMRPRPPSSASSTASPRILRSWPARQRSRWRTSSAC